MHWKDLEHATPTPVCGSSRTEVRSNSHTANSSARRGAASYFGDRGAFRLADRTNDGSGNASK